ncbi:hypothetical protein EDC01DRAFT_707601 [Geopyxis carbonaria]|nr:hypothetical protein EDC01DRAFT_707601 [Geopyxis carbonaria]
MMEFADKLKAESWPLFGVAVAIYVLRIFSRIHFYGYRRLQADDAVMTFVMIAYTVLIVCLNMIASGGGSNLYYESEFSSFSPKMIEERIKGSKIVLVSEQAMLCTIWGVKTCMLIFYTYLTNGLKARRIVKAVICYVFCGFFACEMAMFLQCRPFKGYWAIKPPKPDCATFYSYAFTNMIFNISSDFMMLCIPLPLVYRSKLPLKQKIAVTTIFCMGIFVIVAAILTKVFNLSDMYSVNYMFWYVRESSVALYVSNLPLVWPLIRKVIPGMGTNTGSSNRSKYNVQSSGARLGADVELNTGIGRKSRVQDATLWEDNDSQERLAADATIAPPPVGHIRQDVTFTITTEERVDWPAKSEKARPGVSVTETGETTHNDSEYQVAVRSKNILGSS